MLQMWKNKLEPICSGMLRVQLELQPCKTHSAAEVFDIDSNEIHIVYLSQAMSTKPSKRW